VTQRGFPGKHHGSAFLLHFDGITRSVRFELGLQRGQLFPREIESGKRGSAPILYYSSVRGPWNVTAEV
jgi:hypothetical protein